MKKHILFLFAATCLFSCAKFDDSAIWNELKDHENRIVTLEKLCSQMNTNINSLQSIVKAMEENDHITNVMVNIENGVEVGYTISFLKGDPITIYHGKDGKDGADGAPGKDGQDAIDGQAPVIGVKQDTDGRYYWTLNGEWLKDDAGNKIPTTGNDGQDGAPGADGENGKDGVDGEDGKDGADGQPGTPGVNGADGKDGVTPQLKIENNYWYLSYDNGATWTQLGKATGEDGKDGQDGAPGKDGLDGAPGVDGEDGADGKDGDSMFSNVDITNTEYVIFTLADGTQVKIPTWKAFEDLKALVSKMNTNISALQTVVEALENNDYVTSVFPVSENGKTVGYTINFSKSGAVTIYHGKDGSNGNDGADGASGKDGHDGQTPVIGVRQDTDGRYYWTLNGEWLKDDAGNKIPTTGNDGQDGAPGADGENGKDGVDGEDGKDGADGQPGTPGVNGADGKDGVTPQLKIENNYWYLSYDNGATWTQLGKATGEDGKDGQDGAPGKDGLDGAPGVDGEDGADGKDGDSMFSNVDITNTEYVIFTLADGTQVKIPTWKAFEDLKALVSKMNTNISALQTVVEALENNDYVTSVFPVSENGKTVGYTINFSKSGAVTIYHGKDGSNGNDGADGASGKDGHDGQTPVIGVRQDTDGRYYWTLNGEWLKDDAGNKIPTTGNDGQDGAPGADGEDGKDGADGQPGTPGVNGADGKDGVTPQLKIENNYWYLSYDNGATWTQLGKATGEDGKDGQDGAPGKDGLDGAPGVDGEDGADGKDGDSMFSNVDITNTEYVIFTLADGTQVKIPTWKAFEDLKVLVGKMNTNISALQTAIEALESNDYVTSVNPLTENGIAIGYTITFSKSGSIVIYHGKDGTNGTNGIDGHTPEIGAAKDTDGKYYWTVDGKWLIDEEGNKIPTTGNDGQDGAPGSDGNDGNDGEAGKDGVTPQFKIEAGNWWVSYDNGASWTMVGQATGDQGPAGPQGPQGPQGTSGSNATCMFTSVEWNDSYVYLYLSSGDVLTIPQASLVNAGNGISVSLSTTTEFSALFYGTFTNKGVDMKVTVYYGTSSNLSLYNYLGSATKTSFSGSSFTVTVDQLFSEKTYYYFTETVNNGKTIYSGVSSFKTKAVTGYETTFATDGAVNLSADGTANCYIVSEPGTYCISPVKGNSTTSIGTVSTATVVWETFGTSTTPTRGDLIKGALYQDGKIYFRTNDTFTEGNALIAAKDASGNILWSWHIWMTDKPAEQVYYRNAGTVMDRNLGATSATPGDVKALGLMYQWGRKDPFLGSSSISSPVVAKSTITWPAVKAATASVGTVAYATKNPTVMIRGNNSNEWQYETDKTLWASSKTIYDPCPAGWQIPPTGESGYWVKAYGSHSISGDIFDYTNRGINFGTRFGSDATIWYPATGYYGKADGSFYGTGKDASYPGYTLGDTYGFLEYCVKSDNNSLYLLYVSDFGGADPVRCIKQ